MGKSRHSLIGLLSPCHHRRRGKNAKGAWSKSCTRKRFEMLFFAFYETVALVAARNLGWLSNLHTPIVVVTGVGRGHTVDKYLAYGGAQKVK